MEGRVLFRGTGGELFKELIVPVVLSAITLGVYAPWLIVRLLKSVFQNTTIKRARSDVALEFTGDGGELFKIAFVGALLSAITLGVYLPWFLVKLNDYFLEHARGRAIDGEHYLRSDITGSELFKAAFVGYLLTILSFGIYGAWFICKLQKLLLERTKIYANHQVVGAMEFAGEGGDLFVTLLVSSLLTVVTLGIYGPWMQVNLFKFFASNTEVRIRGQVYRGEFTGTGGEYFVTMLAGSVLTMVTFGVYGFWFAAKLLKLQLEHTRYLALRLSASRAPAPRMVMPPRVAAGA